MGGGTGWVEWRGISGVQRPWRAGPSATSCVGLTTGCENRSTGRGGRSGSHAPPLLPRSVPERKTQRSRPRFAGAAGAPPLRSGCTRSRRRQQPKITAGGNPSCLSDRPPARPSAHPPPRPPLPSPTPAAPRTQPSGASFRAPWSVLWPDKADDVGRVGLRRRQSPARSARGHRQINAERYLDSRRSWSWDGSSANFGVGLSLAHRHEPLTPSETAAVGTAGATQRPPRARDQDGAGWQRQRQEGCRLWRLAAAWRRHAAAAAVIDADGGWR